MAPRWSLDKLGPIGRTVEDCALILAAINGGDITIAHHVRSCSAGMLAAVCARSASAI